MRLCLWRPHRCFKNGLLKLVIVWTCQFTLPWYNSPIEKKTTKNSLKWITDICAQVSRVLCVQVQTSWTTFPTILSTYDLTTRGQSINTCNIIKRIWHKVKPLQYCIGSNSEPLLKLIACLKCKELIIAPDHWQEKMLIRNRNRTTVKH